MKEEELRALFTVANFNIINIYKLANEYMASLTEDSPWWLVETEHGMIKLGWRKRVINIDWSATGYEDDTITSEAVTKSPTSVHAWSKLKAAEYLHILNERMADNLIHFYKNIHTRTLTIDVGKGVPGFIVNRAMSAIDFKAYIQAEIDKAPNDIKPERIQIACGNYISPVPPVAGKHE